WPSSRACFLLPPLANTHNTHGEDHVPCPLLCRTWFPNSREHLHGQPHPHRHSIQRPSSNSFHVLLPDCRDSTNRQACRAQDPISAPRPSGNIFPICPYLEQEPRHSCTLTQCRRWHRDGWTS